MLYGNDWREYLVWYCVYSLCLLMSQSTERTLTTDDSQRKLDVFAVYLNKHLIKLTSREAVCL